MRISISNIYRTRFIRGKAIGAVDLINLSLAFGESEPVLRGISFSVSEGEIFVIAGHSGCGKTSLCRIISGIIPKAVRAELEGEVLILGKNLKNISLPQAAALAGLVFQDADSQIICSAVEDELAFILENQCMEPDDIRKRVDELLLEFGFLDLRHMNPARLSGGQKKLLTIASVLAAEPPVLILDEPFGGLDNEGRAMVRETVMRQRSLGRTVIIVEHDLKLVTFADRWLVLDNGKISACDTPEKLLERKALLEEFGLWSI